MSSEQINFIDLCECYIRFTDEYTQLNQAEKNLRSLCEYVKANKPFNQINEQFEQFVISKASILATGIVLFTNKIVVPGKIFDKASEPVIVIKGERVEYLMNFSLLCYSINSKTSLWSSSDKRKNPAEVCLYVVGLISQIILKYTIESGLSKVLRNSIGMNTYKLCPSNPYNTMAMANIKKFASAMLKNETVSRLADSSFGEGFADKISNGVKNFEVESFLNTNLASTAQQAIASEDADALINVLKSAGTRFISTLDECSDNADPTEQV